MEQDHILYIVSSTDELALLEQREISPLENMIYFSVEPCHASYVEISPSVRTRNTDILKK